MELLNSLVVLESVPSYALLVIAVVYFYKHVKGEQLRHQEEIKELKQCAEKRVSDNRERHQQYIAFIEKKHHDRVVVLKEYVYKKDEVILDMLDHSKYIRDRIDIIGKESGKAVEILKTNQEIMLKSIRKSE